MKIFKKIENEACVVSLDGRLDAYWADHLAAILEEAVQAGSHEIVLECSAVTFLSSAGISVLLRSRNRLQSIRGELRIANPSEAMRQVIALSRLEQVLLTSLAQAPKVRAAARRVEFERHRFDVFERRVESRLECRTIGTPTMPPHGFMAQEARKVVFGQDEFGLGLGSLGSSFDEAKDRFGEFLAAGGIAAHLPSDGTAVPDHSSSASEILFLNGLQCSGKMSRLLRFEASADVRTVPLSEVIRTSLEACAAERIGFVMVAETAGLMGAFLKKSPTVSVRGLFAYPEVRDWLSFTAERAFPKSSSLIVGVAGRGDLGPLGPWLRPLGRDAFLSGHCHAAAFSYRPVPKGDIDLDETVRSLFETQALQGILHLLADYRDINGVGETELQRGALWLSPIDQVRSEHGTVD